MVKTYLSYILGESLGQITNTKNFALSHDKKIIFTSFNDYVMGFEIKSGQEIFKFRDQNIKITSLYTLSNTLIIGYDNGSLYILPNLDENINNKLLKPNKENRTFIHQKGISCINSNMTETRLVLGSVDKLISVIDIISNLVVYKLNGHKEKINDIAFYNKNEQFIFSISDDFCFKIWDTNIQKCVYTYSDTANKLTSFINIDNALLFGTFSQEINIYEINLDNYIQSDIETKLNFKQSEILEAKGVLKKQSNNKTLAFYSNEDIFIVLSNDSSIEMFKILKKKEIKAKLVKYIMNKNKINFLEAQSSMMEIYKQKKYDYKFKYKSIFKFEENFKKNKNKKSTKNSKIFSIFLLNNFKFGYLTNQNSIEIYKYYSNLLSENIYTINPDTKKVETLDQEKDDLSVKKIYSIGQNIGGHHTQVNIVKYSPSNQDFYSISNDEIKLWGGKDLTKALKSQSIKNITSIAFEQDINIILLCSKNGSLFLLNMVSLEIIKTFDKIHSGQISEIISLPYREEKRIIITCSYDKNIKFWNLVEENNDYILDFENEVNALESIVCARVTPDLKFFSYALYDNTIKIYYFDTMKFHLSLYGHKMPVTYYDISSDGTLVVSGGLDKSIKIWGMDFGDCHKTLPAHNDIITCVKFIQDTHFFISCSKDCTMKYYDADTFEFVSLLTNDLLCNQFLSLDINSEGTQIISSCSDNSIKIFNISQEQVVPKLTQEELLEKNMIKEQEKEFNNNNNKVNTNNPYGEKEENVTGQTIKKMDHLTYAENLIEKLNLCEKFKESVIQYHMEVDEYLKNTKLISEDENKIKDVKIYNLNISMEKPRPNILFFNKNIFEVILNEIKKIPYFDLENVLNNISYAYFQKLVYYFEHYIRKNIEIELIGRCIIFFCTLYESQISNDKVILNSLRSIYMRLQGRFKLKYSLIKFNQKSIELIIKKFEDFQKNKNAMEEYNNNNIIDLKE